MLRKLGWTVFGVVLCASVASAHFQMICTDKAALGVGEGSRIALRLLFGHPAENGHPMNMGADKDGKATPPKVFGVVNPKGAWEDLSGALQEMTWSNGDAEGVGYSLPEYRLRGMGDFVFFCDPGPYYEGSEECYIQQVTKVIVNRGGVPTGWNEPLAETAGVRVEILPLTCPYALWTGNVFRGVVMADGKPVPNAEIEVEHAGHAFDMDRNAFDKDGTVEYPQDAFVTQVVYADDQGRFSYGVPKGGWWGFAALGAGGELSHNGKELSMDAVLWVHAQDID